MINLKEMWDQETVSMSDRDWWKKARDKRSLSLHRMIKRAKILCWKNVKKKPLIINYVLL